MIPVSRSFVGFQEAFAAARVIKRGFLGTGKKTQALEKALETFFGNPVVCTVNGTAAIQLALQALGIGKGQEVLVPSLTYVATYQAISATGARPVSCDISPVTLGICLKDAENKISKKTTAIVPVHFAGELSGRAELATFAKKFNLLVVEDAAHAFGSLDEDGGQPEPIGLMAYSFDGIKNITSGEGGCVVGADAELIRRIGDLRLLGVLGDTKKRYRGERSWDFDVTEQGWRFHMSDIMAAIGLVQLRRFAKLAKKRRELARKYETLLVGSKVKFFDRDYSRTVPHIFPVLLPPGANREKITKSLEEAGIQTGRHYKPNHQLSRFAIRGESLPIVEEIGSRILSLPLYPALKKKKLTYIVDSLIRAVD